MLEWFIESGDTEAMEWYQKAADLGSEEAQTFITKIRPFNTTTVRNLPSAPDTYNRKHGVCIF
ncbi:MAG: hypothetical protein NC433_16815 [Clostridiales bacterium]|nr:hypothetical protein [Clostridiales bacterium]